MCWRNLNNGTSRYFGLCQTITPVFMRISQSSFEKDTNNKLVYQSPIFVGTRNPIHEPMRLSLQELCDLKIGSMVKFSVHSFVD